MGNRLIIFISIISGVLAGIWADRTFFWPETKTEIVEIHTTDTLTVEKIVEKPVFLDRLKLEKHIDTVYYSEDYESEISLYEGVEDIEYGQLFWKAETTGQLLSMKFNPSLKIPEKTITNTVTRTEKTTVYNKGLYAGGMVDQNLSPSLSASYIDKKYSFDYQYSIPRKEHSVGVKMKIF